MNATSGLGYTGAVLEDVNDPKKLNFFGLSKLKGRQLIMFCPQIVVFAKDLPSATARGSSTGCGGTVFFAFALPPFCCTGFPPRRGGRGPAASPSVLHEIEDKSNKERRGTCIENAALSDPALRSLLPDETLTVT
jgi:hypothetical protein